ncbi:hypothetical protein ES703_97121 [subsurface metagenome]
MNNMKEVKRSNRAKYKGHLLSLTIKNIKTMFRDRAQLVWIIGYPLILIFALFIILLTSYQLNQ